VRTAEFPFLADWMAISLRWLALLGLAATSAIQNMFSWALIACLVLAVVWNVYVTLLALTNRRLPNHRVVNVSIDAGIALIVLFTSGGAIPVLLWAGLLPLFSASVYYEWLGALFTGLGLTLFQDAWLFWLQGMKAEWLPLAGTAAFNLFAGGVFGGLSIFLMNALRKNYRGQIGRRAESDNRVKKTERERLRALYDMVDALSATLDYQVVMDLALDLGLTMLEGNAADGQLACGVLLFHDDLLMVDAARHFPPRDMTVSFPAENGVLCDAIKKGEMILIKNPVQDPELNRLIALQNCQSLLCLPLIRGLNAFGFMLFAHPDPDFFNPDRQELLEMISRQAVIAIQNARLFSDLEKENERIIASQEETRKKLARDLHDGPTQSVAAIAMRLSVARRMIDINVSETSQELEKIEDLARRTTKEIRHMLFLLRPLALESEGLQAALDAMAQKMNETYQQNVGIDMDPEVTRQLEMGKQTVIFYLAEEAVNNARKHAQASHIWVRLHPLAQEPSILLLEIADDGVGFDVDSVNRGYEKRGSLGMVNLRERTDLVNGLLNIKSAPGQGTRVRVYVPLTPEASERLHSGTAGR
jgi:signal transduction histidine kinase